MGKIRGIALLVVIIFVGLASIPFSNSLEATEHDADYWRMQELLAAHPLDTTEIFALSSRCEHCHGKDETGLSLVDAQGNDVNLFDDWRSSMMANAAKDPFWRAKVSHETSVLPAHATDIETTCTTCHAPLGHYKAMIEGAQHYTIAMMEQDSFGLEGVTCGACHHQSEEELGDLFSGQINFDTNRVAYGPHLFPFSQPMVNFVGFEPKYSEHILDAGLCAGCHTLVSKPFDLDGNPTGGSFIEQATYHEWLNSKYNAEDVSCQACHMPVLEEGVVVASGLSLLTPRKPYGLHELVGANTFMLKLMKEHKETLGILADDDHYDASIASTFDMLQTKSLEVQLEFVEQVQDSALFKVNILNKAGHKFPSGYPSRRAYVEFVVATAQEDTLFISGELGSDYELKGFDASKDYEPHYQTISSEDEVQIYELVNGNINSKFTTVLEQATAPLKDNRLTPIGFSKSHMVYDTTMIVGKADSDPDFNLANGVEGSGTDDLFFKVGLDGFFGPANITAKVYYQALPPNWMKEMFAVSTTEIDQFRGMYDNADQSPVLVQADTLLDITLGTSNVKNALVNTIELKIYPNPAHDEITIELPENLINAKRSYRMYDRLGRLVKQGKIDGPLLIEELKPGVYSLLIDEQFSGQFIKL